MDQFLIFYVFSFIKLWMINFYFFFLNKVLETYKHSLVIGPGLFKIHAKPSFINLDLHIHFNAAFIQNKFI